MKVGSLFSGAGGLDLGINAAIGGTVAWHCENDPAAARVLTHHYPGVPNHGDITTADWAAVEPVNLITAGVPCQDVSLAGRRAGLAPGSRSGLWSAAAAALDHLRPAFVVIENVRGLLSADGHSDVEPCPWCMGDGEGEPVLRACGAILGDLADLGFDAAWCGLRASDVGAAHGRWRVFILGWAEGRTEPAGQLRGPDAPICRAAPADPDGPRLEIGRSVRCDDDPQFAATERDHRNADPAHAGREPRRQGVSELRPGTGADGLRPPQPGRRDSSTPAHADGSPVRTSTKPEPGRGGPSVAGAPGVDWGVYGAAIRRWERILGRPAPAPVEPGSKGGRRLSPRFTEWLMGLPDGWVTDVPALTHEDRSRILGNGVVPQQAAAALTHLAAITNAQIAAEGCRP